MFTILLAEKCPQVKFQPINNQLFPKTGSSAPRITKRGAAARVRRKARSEMSCPCLGHRRLPLRWSAAAARRCASSLERLARARGCPIQGGQLPYLPATSTPRRAPKARKRRSLVSAGRGARRWCQVLPALETVYPVRTRHAGTFPTPPLLHRRFGRNPTLPFPTPAAPFD